MTKLTLEEIENKPLQTSLILIFCFNHIIDFHIFTTIDSCGFSKAFAILVKEKMQQKCHKNAVTQKQVSVLVFVKSINT